jgi:hypothetical protein
VHARHIRWRQERLGRHQRIDVDGIRVEPREPLQAILGRLLHLEQQDLEDGGLLRPHVILDGAVKDVCRVVVQLVVLDVRVEGRVVGILVVAKEQGAFSYFRPLRRGVLLAFGAEGFVDVERVGLLGGLGDFGGDSTEAGGIVFGLGVVGGSWCCC